MKQYPKSWRLNLVPMIVDAAHAQAIVELPGHELSRDKVNPNLGSARFPSQGGVTVQQELYQRAP